MAQHTTKRSNHPSGFPLPPDRELDLKATIVVCDRDFGISIYPNFHGYDNLTDDAEWLLERTPQKSRGFIIRPITTNNQEGIWVGEYNQHSQISRQDFLFCEQAHNLSKTITDYFQRKITDEKLIEKIDSGHLKKRLSQDHK